MTFFSSIDAAAPRLHPRRMGLAIVALLVAAGSVFMTESAHAQQYPPQAASLTVSVRAAAVGDTVTLTASGFGPGTTVTFSLSSETVVLGTAVANANGVAVLTVKIPIGTPLGDHTVSATGVDPQGRPLTVSAAIRVVSRTANGNAALVRTGSNLTEPIARAGLVAVAGGALLVLAARKRRARNVAA